MQTCCQRGVVTGLQLPRNNLVSEGSNNDIAASTIARTSIHPQEQQKRLSHDASQYLFLVCVGVCVGGMPSSW